LWPILSYFHVHILHWLLSAVLQACSHYTLTPAGSASVEEFRRALDEVLEAREEGREPAWLRGAGRSA
jgi:hypothetical protein